MRPLLGSTIFFWTACLSAAEQGQKPFVPNLDLEIKKGPNEKFYQAQITDADYLQMYNKWVDTGLSSLFSAVAQKKLKRQRRSTAKKFGKCSSEATTITKHAKCLSKLLKNEMQPEVISKPKKGARLEKYRSKTAELGWDGGFRTRTERRQRSPKVTQTNSYRLSSNRGQLTPLGSIAKVLLETVKNAKNKTEVPGWQDTVSKLRKNGDKRKRYKKLIEDDSEENMNQMALRGLKEKMLGADGKQTVEDVDLEELMKDPQKLKEFVNAHKKKRKPEERVVDTIRDAMKLVYSIAGKDTTNFDNRTLKLVSPRFLGVVPEEAQDDEINLISPSLFSLHNEGVGVENLTSLPNLLKHAGLQDQQIWLDVIMEAAGVNEEAEKLDGEIKEYEITQTRNLMTNVSSMIDEHGTPLYATKENITELGGDVAPVELFEKLHLSYTKDQLREMNSTGYAVLNNDQLQLLYGEHSPMNNSKALEKFKNLTEDEIHHHMHNNIHEMAEMKKFEVKQRDIVLSPVSFFPVIAMPATASQAFVLSPIIFTPLILSPSVFGAVVLSPWMFVPLVLSPRVLGALVLSPFIFAPIILTPLAVHPAILSPGVFNPLVLSPLVLVPFILSPQVFTPLILSPLCLSPLILNPMVGSPLVLSPFVLSPIIASPMALGALVLSPYALSPVIWSPLIAFAAILSPSWLS
ncbi:unnamed protein product [Bursaphelenchus xylophilus]|uniref:(pine wood nematode) hypothetical protein n=1 Tax=Bursaphelenchus xylophilus TaxID=6326 RepID=A0A1I7SEN2_BURXY|nr:unnamed protein product [Bursaphelenchus xylophilus]CAG9092908.1 unnamed protein product [Bursaphelenchus xylophilus]